MKQVRVLRFSASELDITYSLHLIEDLVAFEFSNSLDLIRRRDSNILSGIIMFHSMRSSMHKTC